jgi:hypothetical protein
MRVRENALPGGRSLLSHESFAAICSNKSNTFCALGEVNVCIKHFYIEMFPYVNDISQSWLQPAFRPALEFGHDPLESGSAG